MFKLTYAPTFPILFGLATPAFAHREELALPAGTVLVEKDTGCPGLIAASQRHLFTSCTVISVQEVDKTTLFDPKVFTKDDYRDPNEVRLYVWELRPSLDVAGSHQTWVMKDSIGNPLMSVAHKPLVFNTDVPDSNVVLTMSRQSSGTVILGMMTPQYPFLPFGK